MLLTRHTVPGSGRGTHLSYHATAQVSSPAVWPTKPSTTSIRSHVGAWSPAALPSVVDSKPSEPSARVKGSSVAKRSATTREQLRVSAEDGAGCSNNYAQNRPQPRVSLQTRIRAQGAGRVTKTVTKTCIRPCGVSPLFKFNRNERVNP